MSAPPDDERRRLSKQYRDTDAGELLRLFEGKANLSPVAVECLRTELRLRGLDPDSLRATVPKSAPNADDEPSAGDATLADADGPPDEVSRSVRAAQRASAHDDDDPEHSPDPGPEEPAPAGASVASLRCPHCGTPNPVSEDLCSSCGKPLEPAQHQTMSRRVTDTGTAVKPAGTVASATSGVIGISALVFASYTLTLQNRLLAVSAGAGALGVLALGAAVFLYRAERRRRDAPTN